MALLFGAGNTISTIVSEEREKKTLRTLLLSGVKTKNYIISTLVFPFAISLASALFIPKILELDLGKQSDTYYLIVLLNAVAIMLIYLFSYWRDKFLCWLWRPYSLKESLKKSILQKNILQKRAEALFLLPTQAKSNFSPWQVTALGVLFSVKYGRWGYHKDTDDYRKAVETLLVGQQSWSPRSRLSSFHRLAELKLERSIFW